MGEEEFRLVELDFNLKRDFFSVFPLLIRRYQRHRFPDEANELPLIGLNVPLVADIDDQGTRLGADTTALVCGSPLETTALVAIRPFRAQLRRIGD